MRLGLGLFLSGLRNNITGVLARALRFNLASNSQYIPALIGAPLIYDNRWGTATDNNGWITFGLKSGGRRIYVDSINGLDANSGLTAALAKQTFNAAWTLWSNNGNGGASTLPGDQLMIAGGAGQTYTDTVGSNTSNFGGLSLTYPNMWICYNSTAPADATQYGRLVGANMPVVNLGNTLNMTAFTNGFVGVQGVELKTTAALAYQALGPTYQTGAKPGLVYQNVRFNGTSFSATSSGPGVADAVSNAQSGLISKSSMWNSGGVFVDEYNGFWFQDFVVAHCGWNIGASRVDTIANGGPQVFTHNWYYHASCTNGRFDRIVSTDSDAGIALRGDVVGMTQLVSIECAFGMSAGGFSTLYTEAPAGTRFKADDVALIGCATTIDGPAHPGGVGIQVENALLGSYARNVAAFDYVNYPNNETGNNRYVALTRRSALMASPSGILCDKWSAWKFAVTEQTSIGADEANISLSWSNSILDVNPVGSLGTVTNCSQRVVAPAGYKTRAQTWTAMGYASKAALTNAMLYRPDLPWAQALLGISLPAMGLTPQYLTASPPVVTSPTVIYPIALGALTIGTLSFTRGTAASTLFGGTSADFVLTSANLPAGFTILGRLLSYDGTGSGAATPTFNVLETSGDTLGTNTTVFTLSIAAGAVAKWAASATWDTSADPAIQCSTASFWSTDVTLLGKSASSCTFQINTLPAGTNALIVGLTNGTVSSYPGNSADIGLFVNTGAVSAGGAAYTGSPFASLIPVVGDTITFDWSDGANIKISKNAGAAVVTVLRSSLTIPATLYPSVSAGNISGARVTLSGW